MEKDLVSVYRPPFSSAYIPTESITLEEVWERITDRGLQDQTTALRILLQEGRKEEYKTSKGNLLPSVTFGGTFDYRTTNTETLSREGKTGLLRGSGFVIIDIDHISETGLSLQELKDRISEDREIGVRLVFTSPSGDGLKVVCRVSSQITDKDSYKTAYNSLRHFINSKYGEIVDKSGSDISRLCLLCCDRDARIQDFEETFSPDLHPVPQKERPVREYTYSYSGEDGIEEIVRRVEESGRDIAPDYGEYIKLVYSFTSLGERGRGLLHRVCSLSSKYRPEDTDKDFNNCLRSGESQSIGTFINMARDNGIDVTKPVDTRTKNEQRDNRVESRKEETPPVQPEETKWEKYLTIPELSQIVSTKREGVKTNYRFETKDKRKEEYLTLRSGAMTLICGKSSHCKSKFLQNISLNLAQDPEDGDILFFTYEEEESEVLSQFANMYADIPGLSQFGTPNTEVILDYFKTSELQRATRGQAEKALPKLKEFEGLYYSGKLRVIYSDLYSEDLCEMVRYYSTKRKIKAVFVDYVQLLYKRPERGRKDRREEIKDICNDLRTLAIDLSIPVVLSAQLNRATPNPVDMSEDNIADSADLTRYANTIVCLWNSYFDNVTGGKENYLQGEDAKRLQDRGFILGEGGKIYAKITKNRGGTPYIDTVLDFRGETGRISTNEDLPLPSLGWEEI